MLPAPFWLALVRAMLVVDDGTRITPLSLHGEGKEEAASPQKRKPTPPRCARQPLPREGARVDAPSFLWKEVPRRGGGWMGKRYERHVGKIVSSAPFTKAPYPPLARSPFPNGEARASLFSHYQSEYTHMWRKIITTDKAFPAWGRWRAERAG